MSAETVHPYAWNDHLSNIQFMLCMVRMSPRCYMTRVVIETPYQFASNNVTGGCQTIATVYQDRSLTEAPTCRNFTYPQPSQVLGVDIAGPDGTWSQFGWVPQVCILSSTVRVHELTGRYYARAVQ